MGKEYSRMMAGYEFKKLNMIAPSSLSLAAKVDLRVKIMASRETC